jgi:hypothetical protein
MDDVAAIEEKVDRILDGLDKGIRGFDQTLANLKSVLGPLDESLRSQCLDYIFALLVQQIRQKSEVDPTRIDRQRKSIGILFRVLFEFGRIDTVLCKIFGFFDVDTPDVVNNWTNCMFQEITSAVYTYSDVISQSALDTLKGYIALFSHPGTDLARAMPGLAPYVLQLNRAIENAEFSRFEQQLRDASPSKPRPEDAGKMLAEGGLSSTVVEAMKKAADYLRGGGLFDPKIAADLMRASIEETSRDIVARLGALTDTQYTGPDKDSERRTHLRKVAFINVAEEKFLSAIYALLSGEGSHKLIAPRETMLVMERTVQDYLLLLVRRLSDFAIPKHGTNP